MKQIKRDCGAQVNQEQIDNNQLYYEVVICATLHTDSHNLFHTDRFLLKPFNLFLIPWNLFYNENQSFIEISC